MDDQPSLVPSAAPRPGADANTGIRLHRGPHGWIVFPAPSLAPKAPNARTITEGKVFPKISLNEFLKCARGLRHQWRTAGTCAAWALYLNVSDSVWVADIPPQLVAGDEVRMDLAFTGFTPAPPNLRLAGSFRSVSTTNPAAIPDLLPPIDGAHFVLDTRFDWLCITAFIHVDGQFRPLAVGDVVHEDPDPFHLSLAQRVKKVEYL